MPPRRRGAPLLWFAGGLLLLAGIWLVGLYVVEGWLRPWGDPDQSRRFWYLPLLLLGVTGVGGGIGVLFGGKRSNR